MVTPSGTCHTRRSLVQDDAGHNTTHLVSIQCDGGEPVESMAEKALADPPSLPRSVQLSYAGPEILRLSMALFCALSLCVRFLLRMTSATK